MPPRSESGHFPIDPAVALAIRYECEQAVAPVLSEVRAINARLGAGDTQIALLNKRVDDLEEEPKTGKTEKSKKEVNPWLMALLSGALGSVGSVGAVWLLIGLGQQAAKGGS